MGHHKHSHGLVSKGLRYSLLINIVITVAEFVGGLISGSLSLLSDALHNFSDVISLLISYIANRIVGKNADFSKTFGYKRAEIIAAFVNASTLILVALYLIKESIVRFFETPESIDSNVVIGLALVSIIGNGICVLLLAKNSKDNLNIRSSYFHLLSDMFTSIAVLVGGLLMKFFQVFWVDSLLTFFMGVYLIDVGWGILKSSFKVLMLFSPEHIIIDDLVERINSIENVKNIHHIHVWLLNEDEVHLEAHVDFDRNLCLSEFDVILEKIKALTREEFGINHINIQPEFEKMDNKSVIVQD